MSDISQAKITDISSTNIQMSRIINKNVSIRVSPNSYFVGILVVTFYAAFLIYLDFSLLALSLLIPAWLLLIFFAFTDRICFDGKRLFRTGYLPRFWNWINASRNFLKLSDIEQVETQALRALKRGGNVFYRYRTSFYGKGRRIAIASGGEEYRRMIENILPQLPENVLDNRSLELRDYLAEPKEALMKAEFAHIPSADVLESSLAKYSKINRNNGKKTFQGTEKADYLRILGNELRLSGYLLQSLEAFRRALVINPKDGWLIFEFARCLHSFASSERDKKLKLKAFAALRLAEKRAAGDIDLLARLGETYFQYGDWRRARKVFHKAMEKADESFRPVRGLAEIALREGKIAHVIHHFLTANRLAETSALRRWTQNEAEYFTRLNDDADYMEMEISRINLLEGLERSLKTCLRITLLGIPAIIFGVSINDALVANIGWAISSIALMIWCGLIIGQKIFSSRIPLDFNEED